MLSPLATRGHRSEKMTKSNACCHHGRLEDTTVIKMSKKWCMLSPWAARGHRGAKMTINGACCHHWLLEDTAVRK